LASLMGRVSVCAQARAGRCAIQARRPPWHRLGRGKLQSGRRRALAKPAKRGACHQLPLLPAAAGIFPGVDLAGRAGCAEGAIIGPAAPRATDLSRSSDRASLDECALDLTVASQQIMNAPQGAGLHLARTDASLLYVCRYPVVGDREQWARPPSRFNGCFGSCVQRVGGQAIAKPPINRDEHET
jgi:hypothetical protein